MCFDVVFFSLPVNQLFELSYGRPHFVALVVPVIRSRTGLLHRVPKVSVRCFKLRPFFTIDERAHPALFDFAIDLPLVLFEPLLRWEPQAIIRLVRDHGSGLGSYLAHGLRNVEHQTKMVLFSLVNANTLTLQLLQTLYAPIANARDKQQQE